MMTNEEQSHLDNNGVPTESAVLRRHWIDTHKQGFTPPKRGYWTRLFLRLTHSIWNREISRVLCEANEQRIINSSQLHTLASRFDPAQDHGVY